MPDRPLLLGHRGARATRPVPENSIASFDLALQHGCDGFEFDVRATNDKVAILCHDPTSGDTKIADAARTELCHLPALEDVLERYRYRAFLDVELKLSGLEELVLKLLEQYPPQRGFVVSSFFADVLQDLHSRNSAIPLGFIADRRDMLDRWRTLPLQWVMPHYRLASRGIIREVQAVGKKVCVWTVNEANIMRRFAELGVDAIISDDTELLVKTLPTR
jgi:glycerophosphoryl diester phosphodiesterase